MGVAAADIRLAEPGIEVGHLLTQGDGCLIILILLILSAAVRVTLRSTKDQHFLLRCRAQVISGDAKAFYT